MTINEAWKSIHPFSGYAVNRFTVHFYTNGSLDPFTRLFVFKTGKRYCSVQYFLWKSRNNVQGPVVDNVMDACLRVPWYRGIGSGVLFQEGTERCGPAAASTVQSLCYDVLHLDWIGAVCSHTARRPPHTGNLQGSKEMSSGKNGELHRQQKRAETTENSPSWSRIFFHRALTSRLA